MYIFSFYLLVLKARAVNIIKIKNILENGIVRPWSFASKSKKKQKTPELYN